jgi:hypothetical protein
MELYGRVKKLHEWNASYLQGPQFVDLSNSKTIGVLMTAKLISALKSKPTPRISEDVRIFMCKKCSPCSGGMHWTFKYSRN